MVTGEKGMGVGASYWIFSVIAIFTLVILVGILDGILALSSEQTISDWLRDNPAWFLWPAGLMVLFLTFLAIHLFVE
jgi:threonine/homoserine/homoserine lactone efflux protein